jgi:hypothetical protein
VLDASQYQPQLLALTAGGIAGGLALFVRGLRAYRSRSRVTGIGTSTISSAAAGEIRVSGQARPAGVTLVSPLQSKPCLYYRATVVVDNGRESATVMRRERGVGFFVTDSTGQMRVFPAGAGWELADSFDEKSGIMGDEPPGLAINQGSEVQASEVDRETAAAALLTVHPAEGGGFDGWGLNGVPGGRRHYKETLLEPDALVTIVGTAVPFGQVPDPTGADASGGPLAALEDPEIAADLARAQASGELAASPGDAWGNAAIPGFGIGKPTRAPTLDPAANPEPVAEPALAARANELFDIAPDTLVLAAAPGAPLTVYAGTPVQAADRAEGRFMVGLIGAVIAIGSAVTMALLLTGVR